MSKRAALPLGVIVATFFMPMAQSCDHTVSPLTYIRESDVAGAFWIAPTFVAAAVLAAAVLWRSLAKSVLALLATGLLVATLPFFAVLFAKEHASVLVALYALAFASSLWLIRRAFRNKQLERLSALLDAYAAAALPLAFTITELGRYYGAYIFLVAYVAFAAQRVFVFLRTRQRA
jgi:hypothetical protein